jgi:hypothetical protein
METPPGPERISRRLREQFAPAYLAITGLVQVLVLDALISKVEGDYTGYGVADWLVVAATFLVCVDIWHEYLMTVLSHVWLPGLLDSLVPFAFLVTELLMVHFVGEDLLGWLLYDPLGLDEVQVAVAAAGLAGVVAIIASSVPMWNQILAYARGTG